MSDTVTLTTKKDWTSDQEVRWCPGCGDYGILLAVQTLMPELGIKPENTVFVSGIGCSSRFPYYMNTYGIHSIHGRAPAIATGIAKDIPEVEIVGDPDADICILGWGSTWAAIDAAVQRTRRKGVKVAWVHLVHLSPLPSNLGEVLKSFKKILVPELNLGQLTRIVRAEYLVDAQCVSKVQGLPFTAAELEKALETAMFAGNGVPS